MTSSFEIRFALNSTSFKFGSDRAIAPKSGLFWLLSLLNETKLNLMTFRHFWTKFRTGSYGRSKQIKLSSWRFENVKGKLSTDPHAPQRKKPNENFVRPSKPKIWSPQLWNPSASGHSSIVLYCSYLLTVCLMCVSPVQLKRVIETQCMLSHDWLYLIRLRAHAALMRNLTLQHAKVLTPSILPNVLEI